MSAKGKPQYRTLVKALDELRQWVDASVLNALSDEEIQGSYRNLYRATVNAEQIVKRAKEHMSAKREEEK